MPIVLGVLNSKIVIITFILTTAFSLMFLNFTFLRDKITFIYFFTLLIIPLVYLIYLIIRADTKKEYHKASNRSKFIMLAGILYAIVANFYIIQNF